MSYSKRNIKKALETIVYLSESDNRHYWILKAIYVADKEHLNRYGRQLFDDTYIAMRLGPVPSLAYDIVKSVRGDGCLSIPDLNPQESISVPDQFKVIALRHANLSQFSDSEIECLKYALSIVSPMKFEQLMEYTHDKAYLASQQNDEMSIDSIISTLENEKEIFEYLDTK